MENKKQTVVEWLIEQFEKGIQYNPLEKDGYSNAHNKLIEQAIEMEKYQILDAFVQGSRFKVDTTQSTPDGIEPEVIGAVDYYDNVYNK